MKKKKTLINRCTCIIVIIVVNIVIIVIAIIIIIIIIIIIVIAYCGSNYSEGHCGFCSLKHCNRDFLYVVCGIHFNIRISGKKMKI